MYHSVEEIFAKINEKQNDINHYKSIINHNYDEIDKFISDQAKLRIKYKNKFNNLINNKFVIFPPNINCEQSSSEATASYKSEIINNLNIIDTNNKNQSRKIKTIIDGSCGFGTDSFAFAQNCEQVLGLDIDKNIIEINNYNVFVNDLSNLSFENKDFENYLDNLIKDNVKIDLIYLDPSRRDNNGKRVFLIEELNPNIFNLLNKLERTTKYLMIKFSPLIDITYLINSFNNILQIDIVEFEKELKEILITIDFDLNININSDKNNYTKVNLVSIKEIDNFKVNSCFYRENDKNIKIDNQTFVNLNNFEYLYEPSPSEMKFANWDIFKDYNKIANNTHLFLIKDESFIDNNFLGKYYQIIENSAIDNKILKKLNINQANIKVRNATIKVEELYKKLKIKNGGDYYIFVFGNDKYKNKMIISKKI